MIPTPKYAIGDKVWAAGTTTRGAMHECPDCLGSKRWWCKSPAGEEMAMDCPRCCVNHCDELSLRYTQYVPYLSQLTIGSVRIDTNDKEHPVSYMCKETGVGSGTIWYESRLHETKQQAESASLLDIADKEAEAKAMPERIRRDELALQPTLYALKSECRRQAFDAAEREVSP